jgi:hypothetical protein
MAKYTSRYAELGFYVNGEFRQFSYGEFKTDNPDEITVLDKLADAVRVDNEVKSEEPAAKAPTTRKASAKSSAE